MILVLVLSCFYIPCICVLFYAAEHDFPYHKEATIRNSKSWGYGDFDSFMREFEKVKWERSPEFEDCYVFRPDDPFFSDFDFYINAGIVKFEGKGFIFKKRSEFGKFKRFMKRNRICKESVDWKKNTTPVKKYKIVQMPHSNQSPSS